jgi:hypothetical protein
MAGRKLKTPKSPRVSAGEGRKQLAMEVARIGQDSLPPTGICKDLCQ